MAFVYGASKENDGYKTKAERLFDLLIKPELNKERSVREPLAQKSNNRSSDNQKASTSGAKTRTRRKAAGKVRFEAEDDVQLVTPKLNRNKQPKKPKKNVDYPDCTKEALEKAFQMANLPDFDAIAKFELHVTAEDNNNKPPPTEKQSTPNLAELLAPFEDVVDFDKLTNSEKRAMKLGARTKRRADNSSLKTVHDDEDSLVAIKRTSVNPIDVRVLESTPVRRSPRVKPKTAVAHPFVTVNRRKVTQSSPLKLVLNEEFVRCRGKPTKQSTPVQEVQGPKTFIQHSHDSDLMSEIGGNGSAYQTAYLTCRSELPSFMPGMSTRKEVTRAGHRATQRRMTVKGSIVPDSFAKSTVLQQSKAKSDASLHEHNSVVMPSFMSHHTVFSVPQSSILSHTARTNRLSRSRISTRSSLSRQEGSESTLVPKDQLKAFLHETLAAAFTQTVCHKEDGEEEVVGPIEKVLALCEPDVITDYFEIFDEQVMQNLKKIGEGSYGEIYKSFDDDNNEIVLKLVPCSLDLEVEEAFEKILPEIMITKKFGRLRDSDKNRTRNFVTMTRSACLKGKFPAKLIEEWDKYDQAKTIGSENVDPREYGDDHLHVVMILNNGGVDLEKYRFKSAVEALSVFKQIAYSLAAAECEFEFEHRDLHWGNVLVNDTKAETLTYIVNGQETNVKSSGVFATIIDFTLSRMSEKEIIVFDDLSRDEELFQGKGDYQFDVYRLMKEENGNNWEEFTPKTNVLWLDYLLDKLITGKQYTSRSQLHKSNLAHLKKIRKQLLNYSSAQDFIENCKLLK